MEFLGQWKTSENFRVKLTSYDGHRSRGIIEAAGSLELEGDHLNIEFDSDGYPIDNPYVGKLMTKRRGKEKW